MKSVRSNMVVVTAMTLVCISCISRQVTAQDGPPKSIEDGVARLEALLGKFDKTGARQFHIAIDTERQGRSAGNQTGVTPTRKGWVIIGNPYRFGDGVCFDVVETIKLSRAGSSDSAKRGVVQRHQRYATTRFTFRLQGGKAWRFDAVIMASSDPNRIGLPLLRGTVEWRPSGVRLKGVSADSVVDDGGAIIPVIDYTSISMARKGDELNLEDEWQSFHVAKPSDGNDLPSPDFKRPFGSAAKRIGGKGTLE
jgi:hypothetical protein